MQVLLKKSRNSVPYEEAYEFLNTYQNNIYTKGAASMIWFLEHPDIITAGRSATNDQLFNHDRLKVKYIERGGKFTYHGPGQRIVYFLLNLKEWSHNQQPDIRMFVRKLEEWLILSLSELDITTHADIEKVGIWTKYNNVDAKIAAIGLRVKHWITSHGIALNIVPDLNKFTNIVPCGIENAGVTSITEILGYTPNTELIDAILITNLNKVLNIQVYE